MSITRPPRLGPREDSLRVRFNLSEDQRKSATDHGLVLVVRHPRKDYVATLDADGHALMTETSYKRLLEAGVDVAEVNRISNPPPQRIGPGPSRLHQLSVWQVVEGAASELAPPGVAARYEQRRVTVEG